MNKKKKAEALAAVRQTQIEHLEQHGWVKSTKQERWMYPHWERSEPGYYIANLKRAYAQQLKFEAKLREPKDELIGDMHYDGLRHYAGADDPRAGL